MKTLKTPTVIDPTEKDLNSYSSIKYSLIEDGISIPINIFFLQQGVSSRPQNETFNHPSPNFDRIFMFRKGYADIVSNGKELRLEPSRIYILPVSQSFRVTYSPDSELYFFHVRIEDEMGLPIFSKLKGFPFIEDCNMIFKQITEGLAQECSTVWQSFVFQVILHFSETLLLDLKMQAQKAEKFSELISYIKNNPSSKLRVKEIAKKLHISRTALSKGFQRAMGISLKSYISEIQLRKAKELLIQTDRRIAEIAYQLDYDEPYYFHRVFKKLTNETPCEFRVNARKRLLNQ